MILAGAVLYASILAPLSAHSASPPPEVPPTPFLRLVQTISLPDVKGRIDHLALDAERDRLYVAALGNDSLEVVDLHAKKRLASVGGMSEPQGVLYLDSPDVVLVSNGGSGKLLVLDGETRKPVRILDVGEDADNLRYDAQEKRVFVAYGRGAIGILDPLTWKTLGRMSVSAHPEAFALDPRGTRVFVNVPGERSIAVVDRATQKTIAVWPVDSAQANYPMILISGAAPVGGGSLVGSGSHPGDEGAAASERLLVGCRSPAKLLVYDTQSGKETAALDLSGDVDDIFFDAERQRVYASCGAGSIDVFERKASGELAPAAKIATRRGARTSLFAPQKKCLYLAVPEQDASSAELRVYEVVP